MGLLKPRTAKVLIYHGDDMEHLAELKRAVVRAEAEAEQAAPPSSRRFALRPGRGPDQLKIFRLLQPPRIHHPAAQNSQLRFSDSPT